MGFANFCNTFYPSFNWFVCNKWHRDFSKVDAGQAQIRLRLPTGTRMERTEDAINENIAIADSITNNKVEIMIGFCRYTTNNFCHQFYSLMDEWTKWSS